MGPGRGSAAGSIVSYAWSFGDGKTGTGTTPSHYYPNGGTYQVRLTVTDDEGDTSSQTLPINVLSAASGDSSGSTPPPPSAKTELQHHRKHKKHRRHRKHRKNRKRKRARIRPSAWAVGPVQSPAAN